eukprot:TRINITY_DN12887_c0_g1_i1.p1 TRINITY_DN12887_c0_g1~~TRINITY_DN12887_c0_g1_i1.p1  ORF type:complete len:318 (+),score=60.48 TRINITY_DN12887_c0_g1_i1:31-984(+)
MTAPVASQKVQNDHLLKFVGGGLSCMTAACFTNPVDVIKTRLQIQGELSTSGVDKDYKGFTRGLLRIVRDESLLGLYKGLVPSLLREGTYSTLRMGGYEIVRDFLARHSSRGAGTNTGTTPLWQKILAGMISGALGAAIANPTDLVKVRLQAEGRLSPGQTKRYKGTVDAFKKITQQEGLKGLYKGVGPTTQRAALLTASQLSSYDHFKHLLIRHTGLHEGIVAHFFSSIAAGFVAALVTSPVDTVKTRIMNQPIDKNGKGILYSSTSDCFKKTITAEGLLGLYKGFVPNWMRIGPHTIVTFIVFEQFRKAVGLSPV